jgi:hypothetical protein
MERQGDADEKLLYVRECFDELYFKLGQLQDAIKNGLVELSHVSCPIDYYVPILAADVQLHYHHLNHFKYGHTLDFVRNFAVWKDAVMSKGLECSSP